MRIVLQRVKRACVSVNANITGSIDNGILILLGIHNSDTPKQADYLAESLDHQFGFSSKFHFQMAKTGG